MPLEEDVTEAGSTRPWLAERVERWAIERLIPYADNARLHSEADIDKLAHSLCRWGWTIPLLVDENGVLICGHGRIRAAALATAAASGSALLSVTEPRLRGRSRQTWQDSTCPRWNRRA